VKTPIKLANSETLKKTTIWLPMRQKLIVIKSVAIAISCLAVAPRLFALDPPPDGAYPGNNTAEGGGALFTLDSNLGSDNTAVGFSALYGNHSGDQNTAIGSLALLNAYTSGNTAIGAFALLNNTFGGNNTAVGLNALYSNGGSDNTAIGVNALYSNFTYENTAIGAYALASFASEASGMTAVGAYALTSNTTGYANTALGYSALKKTTEGYQNTAVGDLALDSNVTGSGNTATGSSALLFNVGSNNTAFGAEAAEGSNFTTGSNNTTVGGNSLSNLTSGGSNSALGYNALLNITTGSSNIAVGESAGSLLTTGSNNIEIGHEGNAGDSNTIRIGKKGVHTKTVIAGIRGTTVASGISVFIDGNGRLGTTTSSARFKSEIKPMAKASEAIFALEPVTFRYKQELDPDQIPQFGLVAEQVAKVNPDLVAHDEDGKPYTVRYEAVNAMLLNEFLKEHRKGQEQDATLAELRSAIAQQQKEIKALTLGLKVQADQIQKVSAERAISDPTTSLIATND
jgi:trimeric autotransporter adhesin